MTQHKKPLAKKTEADVRQKHSALFQPVLDEEKRRQVLGILRSGGTRQRAAQLVGCHPRTILRTAQRDPQFGCEVSQAEALHEFHYLQNINNAARDTRYWRAAAWALERLYPAHYAPRRPRGLTAEQIHAALEEFADVIVEEVGDEAIQTRILLQLDALAQQLADDEISDQDIQI